MPYYAYIPLLPVAAFVVLVLLGRRAKHWAHWVAAPAVGGSLALSLLAAYQTWASHGEEAMHVTFDWAQVGHAVFRFGLQVDALTAVMLVVVTVVALLVQVYSVGYMHGEARYGWYYAVLSLFTAAMLALVVADNYLLMYMAWEGVGLCSYLLIGFWFEDEEPQQASKKAFIVTRLGDVGFGLGVIAIFALAGTFTFGPVFESAEQWTTGAATLVALLLFAGAVGKSAQFPLHVWLPDAMAGPTPVSALIHAATMVAAGVYLVARTLPIFEASGVAMTVVLVIGAITALGAGLIAVAMYDIKKILAYSTISQLGYMMMALGAGSLVAGMFHLTTHAFFKALLFLGSGSVIHATHTQDIRKMGGLAKTMPATTWTFVVGSLALAGVFPLSGFFSKDEILASISHADTPAVIGGVAVNDIVFVVAVLAAGLTAFYMARLCFRVFWGDTVESHESPLAMTVPLVLLAIPAIAAGWFAHSFAELIHPEEAPATIDLLIAGGSTAVALAGIGFGWWIYMAKRVSTDRLRERLGLVHVLMSKKFYVDELYDNGVVRPVLAACSGLARFDLGVIDWVVNAAARVTIWLSEVQRRFDEGVVDRLVGWTAAAAPLSGRLLRRVQTGSLNSYVRLTLAAVVGLMVWFTLRG